MNPNKVFILLATYNRVNLVVETLKSIQKQTYKEWQCIIVDDFSTDDTEKVILQFIADDPRFSFHPKTVEYSKGLSGSRNYGLDLAQEKGAKFIQFFDDDDIVHPQNLEITTKEILRDGADYCRYVRHAFVEEFHGKFDFSEDYDNKTLNLNHLEKMVTGEIAFNSCQVLWKMDCFKNERFNESLHYAEEWELYQRILAKGLRGVSIDKVLYFARKHPESNTGEFWDGKKIRKNSYTKAAMLVLENLYEKGYLTKRIERFFFKFSISHKESAIFFSLLKKVDSPIRKSKYIMLRMLYPITIVGYRYKRKYTKNKK